MIVSRSCRKRTILHQNVQTGSDKEVIVEHDESEGKRQDIVTSPDLEEFAYGRLEAISQSTVHM